MTKILFICHGIICRSPMAEFVMKDMVRKRGLEAEFEIASAATNREEIGYPVYPPSQAELSWLHIKTICHIYEDGELDQESTVRKFRTVQMEGTREVKNDESLIYLPR